MLISSPETSILFISAVPSFLSWAYLIIGTFIGSKPIIVLATASNATPSKPARINPTFLGSPALGPLPSIPITASITVICGCTISKTSTNAWAIDLFFGASKCTFFFPFAGTEPNIFLIAPVYLVSPCVFSFGTFTTTSTDLTVFAILNSFKIAALLFVMSSASSLSKFTIMAPVSSAILSICVTLKPLSVEPVLRLPQESPMQTSHP